MHQNLGFAQPLLTSLARRLLVGKCLQERFELRVQAVSVLLFYEIVAVAGILGYGGVDRC